MPLKSFVAAKPPGYTEPWNCQGGDTRGWAAAVSLSSVPGPSLCLVERTRQLISNHLKTTSVGEVPQEVQLVAPQPRLLCLSHSWFGWAPWGAEGAESQAEPEEMGRSERRGGAAMGWVLSAAPWLGQSWCASGFQSALSAWPKADSNNSPTFSKCFETIYLRL